MDVVVIHDAFGVLTPSRALGRKPMPSATAKALYQEREKLEATLNRLREVTAGLYGTEPTVAAKLIADGNQTIAREVVEYEMADKSNIYPRLAGVLRDGHGLGAMSSAHHRILHLARFFNRLATDTIPTDADNYLIRNA